MSRLQTRLSIIAAVVLLAACSKTGSPPNTFGVNLTVDGSAVSAADRTKIKTGQLHVLSDNPGAAVIMRTVDGFPSAIQGGVARFHYTPGADVAAGDTLRFELDGLDAAGIIIASGTSLKVTLTATAVPATIMLAGPSGDGGVPPGDGGSGDGNGKGNGTACLTGTECASAFCADGVCCNEKCDDVCVSCNGSPATKGTCTPYTAGTDPEMECAAKIDTTPTPDAGGDAMTTGDGASGDAAAEAAASADASAASGDAGDGSAATSDAELISEPDGGFMTTPTACAGTCGGARSCKYPDSKTTCGTPFCNSHKDVASFVCDGNGGCAITLGACTAYACDDTTSACRTTCSAPIECQLDKFCNGNDECVDKKTDGLTCTTRDECKSGYCSTGVCCNTDCASPFSCNDPSGTPGQCKCPGVTCAAGVACQVFYQDADGDGYGNASGVVGPLSVTAKAGCAGSPPAGYVADNTDCDDNNINAHPNQSAYFGTPRSNGSFDYNCDGNGTSDFGTPEYPGVACRFCGSPGTCTTSPTFCSSGATESFQCPEENLLIERLAEPISLGGSGELVSRLSPVQPVEPVEPVQPIVPVQPIGRYCCGCRTTDKTGFITAVPCGAYNYVYTCGSCGATTETKGAYTQQTCR